MTSRILRLFLVSIFAVSFLPRCTFPQTTPSERIYKKSKTEVDIALQQLRPSLGGRLPVLDGFVDTDQALTGYSQGYYQCSVQVAPASTGGTLVRVTAKITAWYAGSASAQAGYRVLPSNGRLEADFLDRMGNTLGGGGSSPNFPAVSAPANEMDNSHRVSSAPQSGPLLNSAPDTKLRLAMPNSASNGSAALPNGPDATLSGAAANAPLPAASSVPAELASEDLASLRIRLEKAERRRKSLDADVQNLEEIQRNQAHPTDLAVVKKPATPVLSKPESTARALFRADVGDEFQVIEEHENWVHVQISGVSRGWIKRTELDLPGAVEPPRAGEDTKQSEGSAFRVSREETKPFPGDWEPLRGKTVRIVWVEPASASPTSTADAKRTFAKSLFRKTYQEIASATPADAGVVIVFDSADGGQISATLATLKEWQAGSLTEISFWKQCAVDPPDLLQNSSKAAGGNF